MGTRRGWVYIAIGVLTVAGAVVAAPAEAQASPPTGAPRAGAPRAFVAAAGWTPADWTQVGYGPGNTGYNPHESRINRATVDDLVRRWTVTPGTGRPGCSPAVEAPLVADGRVVLADRGGIGAYDVESGRRLWRHPAFDLLGPMLAVAGDTVLATDSSCLSASNYDGTVTALGLDTGERRWRVRRSGTVDALVVDSGVVVAHGYCGTCGDVSHEVYGLRVHDGRLLWRHAHVRLAGAVSAGGRVLLTRTGPGSGSFTVHAASGRVGWRSPVAWQARGADPAGERFFLSHAGRLRAVDAGTGRTVWSVEGGGSGPLAADGRRVFVAATDSITAHHAGTGRRLWTRRLEAVGRPIRAGGLLYATSGATLRVLSPPDGRVLSPGARPRSATGHVVVAGGRLFVSDGRSVRAYAP